MVPLSDVFKVIGPNASIVFASWIFMGFLQQRYDGALGRYRQAVGDYRSNQHDPSRSKNLKSQVLAYWHRCRLMSRATLLGLVAAILLISSLIVSGLDVMMPKNNIVTVSGIATTMGGLLLVIAAAFIVILEAQVVKRQIDDELRDVAELAEEVGGVVDQSPDRDESKPGR